MYSIRKNIKSETLVFKAFSFRDIAIILLMVAFAIKTSTLNLINQYKVEYVTLMFALSIFLVSKNRINVGHRNYEILKAYLLSKPHKVYATMNVVKAKKHKGVFDLVNIINIKNNTIYLKNGYAKLFQVPPIDLFRLSKDETELLITSIDEYYNAYSSSIKWITLSYPVNYKQAINNLERKKQETEDQTKLHFLIKKINELKELEKTKVDREYFLMIYGKSLNHLSESETITKRFLSELKLQDVSDEKTKNIFEKLNNLNSNI